MLCQPRSVNHRCQRALHVDAAPSPYFFFDYIAAVGRVRPTGQITRVYMVHMAVEHQRQPISATHPTNYISQRVGQYFVIIQMFHLSPDEAGYLSLVTRQAGGLD